MVKGLDDRTVSIYRPIQSRLTEVEERLHNLCHTNVPDLEPLLGYALSGGGKRIRPALLLLSAQAVGEVNDTHHTLAAVVEMIHTATLVHDDVLDEAETRRHVATVNARWNNETSVLFFLSVRSD